MSSSWIVKGEEGLAENGNPRVGGEEAGRRIAHDEHGREKSYAYSGALHMNNEPHSGSGSTGSDAQLWAPPYTMGLRALGSSEANLMGTTPFM